MTMTPSRKPPSFTNVDRQSSLGESPKLQNTFLLRPVFANSANEEGWTSTKSNCQNLLRERPKLQNGSQPEFAKSETANEVVNSPPFTSRMNKPVFGLSPAAHKLMEGTREEAEKIKAHIVVAKSGSGTADDLCDFPPRRTSTRVQKKSKTANWQRDPFVPDLPDTDLSFLLSDLDASKPEHMSTGRTFHLFSRHKELVQRVQPRRYSYQKVQNAQTMLRPTDKAHAWLEDQEPKLSHGNDRRSSSFAEAIASSDPYVFKKVQGAGTDQNFVKLKDKESPQLPTSPASASPLPSTAHNVKPDSKDKPPHLKSKKSQATSPPEAARSETTFTLSQAASAPEFSLSKGMFGQSQAISATKPARPRFTFGQAQFTTIFNPLQRNTPAASDVGMKGQKGRDSSYIFRKSSATSSKYATPGMSSTEQQYEPKIAHTDAVASTATPPEEAQRSVVPELHALSNYYRASGNRIRILEAKERGHLMQIQALEEVKRLHLETIESQFATIGAQFRTIDLLREELKGARDQIRAEVTAEFEKKNLEQSDTEVSTLKSKIEILEVEKRDLCELLISTKQNTDMGKALKECEERLNDMKRALGGSTIYA